MIFRRGFLASRAGQRGSAWAQRRRLIFSFSHRWHEFDEAGNAVESCRRVNFAPMPLNLLLQPNLD
jgi:hypothetical protein